MTGTNPRHELWARFKAGTADYRPNLILNGGPHTHVRMLHETEPSWDVVTWPGHVAFTMHRDVMQNRNIRFDDCVIQDTHTGPAELFRAAGVYSDGAPKLDLDAVVERCNIPDDHTRHDTDKVVSAVRAHLDAEGVTGRRRERALGDAGYLHSDQAVRDWMRHDRLFRHADPWQWSFNDFRDVTDRFVMTCWAIHATLNHLQEKTP